MLTRAQVKKLMPAGSVTSKFGGRVEWRKRGGHPDAQIRRVLERANKLGFKPGYSSEACSPDGNYIHSRRHYSNDDGDVLVVSKSYGVTASENRFSITLILPEGAK